MAIRAGGTCRGIAREQGVSPDTVRRIAKAANVNEPFARTNTQNATRAKVADMAARRTVIAGALLDDIDRLRERAWSQYKLPVSSEAGTYLLTLDLPPLGEVRNAYAAVGICADKHLAFVRHDADTGAEGARSMLGALAAGLQVAYDQMTPEEGESSS